MNLMGRALLFLFGAAWIAAATGVILLAWNSDKKVDIDVKDFNLQAFVEADDAERWGTTVVVGAIGLLGVAALLVAVLPARARARRGLVRLRQSDGGTVEVSNEALEGLLAGELALLPEVRGATAAIRVRGRAISTDLDLLVAPGVRIADVTRVVGTRLTEVFRDQVGVAQVHRPLVRVRYEEESPAGPMSDDSAAPEPPLPPPPPPLDDEDHDD